MSGSLSRLGTPGCSSMRSFPVLLSRTVIIVTWLGSTAPSAAQISPGELSSAHQSLEGITHCTSCHAIGRSIDENSCLGCHTELSTRLKAGKGLHATFSGKACITCHKEHHGRDFDLVRLERQTFDHSRTGYRLDGKHAQTQCQKCHTSSLIRAEDILANRPLLEGGTFLGLSTDCSSCHTDPHKGSLGPACASCHSETAWKPAPGFKHGRTRFPLTGRHVEVRCESCHRRSPEPGGRTAYAGLQFEDCNSCHRDVHAGRFPQRCASCHTTAGWFSAGQTFNHASTRFPLRGAHLRVRCQGCHGGTETPRARGAGTHVRLVQFEHCSDCHQDPHRGQFTKRADGGACEGCHTEASWEVRSIAGFDHATTRFPLRGRHATVKCAQCHGTGPASAAAIDPRRFERCADCHRDAHAGQFAARSDGGACESCHDEKGFLPPNYFVNSHAHSRFPLQGAHLAVACTRCHKLGTVRGERVRVFRKAEPASCATCHKDVHRGVFAQWMTDGCATCHGTDGWTRVRFAHQRTRFRLVGKHSHISCAACHQSAETTEWHFARTPKECSSCHGTTAHPPQGAGI